MRENTEGLYTGAGGFLLKGTPHEVAIQEIDQHAQGVERCLRYAFEYARKRNDGRSSRSAARRTCSPSRSTSGSAPSTRSAQRDYPDIKRDYAHVDATCMWMVKNPEWFDVIVTDNMFGDIITDLGAMIQGGMGIAAGGNINPGQGVDVRADRRLGAEVHRARTSSIRSPPSAPAR